MKANFDAERRILMRAINKITGEIKKVGTDELGRLLIPLDEEGSEFEIADKRIWEICKEEKKVPKKKRALRIEDFIQARKKENRTAEKALLDAIFKSS
jgi:predicted AAA+ superfamily ATPase